SRPNSAAIRSPCVLASHSPSRPRQWVVVLSRILVTGGAGFIGPHFVRRLADAGDEVVVLDKLRYSGNPANLDGVAHEVHDGDIERGKSSREDDPIRPSSPYSASKAGGDLQVLAYIRTYGVNASITRGANTYGSHQYPEKLIPLMVTNALDGEALPVYGDGRQRREWI